MKQPERADSVKWNQPFMMMHSIVANSNAGVSFSSPSPCAKCRRNSG